MCGDDQRGARGEGGREPGWHEEVRVCDIGTERACDPTRVADETEMAAPPAPSGVHRRPLDLVAAPDELALEVRDEDAQVRIGRARVHLGDEEDAQRVTRA
jgi:hypothetical protein